MTDDLFGKNDGYDAALKKAFDKRPLTPLQEAGYKTDEAANPVNSGKAKVGAFPNQLNIKDPRIAAAEMSMPNMLPNSTSDVMKPVNNSTLTGDVLKSAGFPNLAATANKSPPITITEQLSETPVQSAAAAPVETKTAPIVATTGTGTETPIPAPTNEEQSMAAKGFVPKVGMNGIYESAKVNAAGKPISYTDAKSVASSAFGKTTYIEPQRDQNGNAITPESKIPEQPVYQQANIQSNVTPNREANQAIQNQIAQARNIIATGDMSKGSDRIQAKYAQKFLDSMMDNDVRGKLATQLAQDAQGQKDFSQRRESVMEGWKALLAGEKADKELAQRGAEFGQEIGYKYNALDSDREKADKKAKYENEKYLNEPVQTSTNEMTGAKSFSSRGELIKQNQIKQAQQRIAKAQAAMADPNAPKEVKEQAQKILEASKQQG